MLSENTEIHSELNSLRKKNDCAILDPELFVLAGVAAVVFVMGASSFSGLGFGGSRRHV